MRKLIAAVGVIGVVLGLGVVPAAAGPSGDNEAFCQARIEAEEKFGELFETDEPDQDVIDEINGLLDELDQSAPAEIATQVTTVTGALRQGLETEFESDPFEDPAVQEAATAIDAFINANCGFVILDVTALD